MPGRLLSASFTRWHLIFPRTQWNKTNTTFVLWIRKPKFREVFCPRSQTGAGPGSALVCLAVVSIINLCYAAAAVRRLMGWVVFSLRGFWKTLNVWGNIFNVRDLTYRLIQNSTIFLKNGSVWYPWSLSPKAPIYRRCVLLIAVLLDGDYAPSFYRTWSSSLVLFTYLCASEVLLNHPVLWDSPLVLGMGVVGLSLTLYCLGNSLGLTFLSSVDLE